MEKLRLLDTISNEVKQLIRSLDDCGAAYIQEVMVARRQELKVVLVSDFGGIG